MDPDTDVGPMPISAIRAMLLLAIGAIHQITIPAGLIPDAGIKPQDAKAAADIGDSQSKYF